MNASAYVLPELTLPQMLREQAARIPDRIAIRQKDFGIWRPYRWRDYWQRSCHVGMGLQARGVSPGGHVGVLSENRIEWVLSQMGAGVIGAVIVASSSMSPSPELGYVMHRADVEMVV